MSKRRKHADRDADHKDANASRQVALDSICNSLHGGFSDLYRSERHEPDASLSA